MRDCLDQGQRVLQPMLHLAGQRCCLLLRGRKLVENAMHE